MAYTKSTSIGTDVPVQLSIRGEQCYDNQEPEVTEQTANAVLTVLPENSFRIAYQDAGLDGTATVINIRPNQLVLTRRGAVDSRMMFVTGEHNISQYRTPWGVTQMCIRTDKLQYRLSERGGIVLLRYQLSLSGQDAARCRLRIRAQLPS